ncbi:putative TonB-dependent receptor [Hyphomonas adhaerens MHS-3]|uniref:Putative TonB-dependent receptor n=1 Tax=Hyphomonas adhaerens MHS-3 TaxID=1280949 RepID=A0A069E9L5_9PROT|nr:TonB-dependent receptor [Hyphomonas adhaerens]KCZ86091.1 putative TonB-dependent receptor [Hyphomonas adhaerens MHS-3]
MKKNIWSLTSTIALLLGGVAIAGGAASAQNADADRADTEVRQLDTVTVTAQKREQSAQDVPVSITAVSGEQIVEAGAGNLEDLKGYLPNVEIVDSPGRNRVVIRGLGSGAGNIAFEQSVGMYIDGIYASRAALFQAPFLDMERVEVLKGPQGVLFGKNSIAGAVSVITNKPTSEFEAEISGSYEFEHESYEVTGILSGQIAEGLYGRIAAKTSDEGAFMDNPVLGRDVPELNTNVVRGTLVWDASPDTELMLKVEGSKFNNDGSSWQLFADYSPGTLPYIAENDPASLPPGLFAPIYFGSRALGEDFILDNTSFINEEEATEQESFTTTFQAKHDFGSNELTYLFGYGEFDRSQFTDQDFSAAQVLSLDRGEDFNQFSHELRLASTGGGPLDYLVGLYYLDREFTLTTYQNLLGNLPPAAAFSLGGSYTENTSSLSAFGQVTWHVSDVLRLTGGLRYSEEDKDASKENSTYEFGSTSVLKPQPTNPARPNYSIDDSRSESGIDPAISVQWDVGPSAMLYASWTRASKAGGFNSQDVTGTLENFSYDEETAEAWELGVKAELLDRRLRTNASIFRTKFDDLQVGAFDPRISAFAVTNASKAISQGAELEVLFALSDSITIGSNIAYLDAEYEDFVVSCPDNPVAAARLDCFIGGTPARPLVDLEGVTLENAPEITSSSFIEYNQLVGNSFEFTTKLDASFKDETTLNFSQDYNLMSEPVWKLNLRVALANLDNGWEVAASAYNLTDEQPITFAGQAFSQPGVYWATRDRGREVRVSARYRF